MNNVRAVTTELLPTSTSTSSGSHQNLREISPRRMGKNTSEIFVREQNIEGAELGKAETEAEKHKKDVGKPEFTQRWKLDAVDGIWIFSLALFGLGLASALYHKVIRPWWWKREEKKVASSGGLPLSNGAAAAAR